MHGLLKAYFFQLSQSFIFTQDFQAYEIFEEPCLHFCWTFCNRIVQQMHVVLEARFFTSVYEIVLKRTNQSVCFILLGN